MLNCYAPQICIKRSTMTNRAGLFICLGLRIFFPPLSIMEGTAKRPVQRKTVTSAGWRLSLPLARSLARAGGRAIPHTRVPPTTAPPHRPGVRLRHFVAVLTEGGGPQPPPEPRHSRVPPNQQQKKRLHDIREAGGGK